MNLAIGKMIKKPIVDVFYADIPGHVLVQPHLERIAQGVRHGIGIDILPDIETWLLLVLRFALQVFVSLLHIRNDLVNDGESRGIGNVRAPGNLLK